MKIPYKQLTLANELIQEIHRIVLHNYSPKSYNFEIQDGYDDDEIRLEFTLDWYDRITILYFRITEDKYEIEVSEDNYEEFNEEVFWRQLYFKVKFKKDEE
jgi:hypothetical protein